MLLDALPYVLVGAGLFGVRYLLDRALNFAPPPDGLDPGEKLVHSVAAVLELDGVGGARGVGYAYLTDSRLVWSPAVGRIDRFWNRRRGLTDGGPYAEPIILGLRDIRRVDLRFYLGGSQMRVETEDMRLDLSVSGHSFGGWERYIEVHATSLLPYGVPVPRSRSRYARDEVVAASRYDAVFVGALTLFLGARLLRVLGQAGLSAMDVALILVAYVCIAVALILRSWR